MFPKNIPQSFVPKSGRGVMFAAALVSVTAFLTWVRSQASYNKVSVSRDTAKASKMLGLIVVI
jgi:hypothetical protein